MSFGGSSGGTSYIKTSGDVALSNPQTGNILVYDGTLSKWENQSLSGATASSLGGIQLAGDLGGTATAPTVPGLASKVGSVTAADSTITLGGTATAPTLKVNAIAESQVTNLSTDLAARVQVAGDIGGTATTPTVTGLQGRAVSSTAPTSSQVLSWNGTAWAPATVSGGGGSASYPNNSGTATVVDRPHKVNVLDYGAVGDGTTDDTAAIQSALNACPKGGIVFLPALSASGYTTYKISAPLIVPGGIVVEGDYSGTTTGFGVTVQTASGATSATWNAMGVFTASAYYNKDSSTSGNLGDQIVIRNLRIDHNSNKKGNGIITMNKYIRIENVMICNVDATDATDNWTCTTNMASPVQTTGNGYGIVLASCSYDGTVTMIQNGPEQRIVHCRIQSSNSRIYTNSGVGSNGGTYTDSFLINNIMIVAPTQLSTLSPDVYVDAAGGWLIQGNHWNHSAKTALQLGGSTDTRIIGNYFDGWAMGQDLNAGTTTSQYVGLQVKITNASGTSNIVIADNSFRWQNVYDSAKTVGVSGKLIAIQITAPTAGYAFSAAITGNTFGVQSQNGTQPSPTAQAILFNLVGNSGTNWLETTIAGNSAVDSRNTNGIWSDGDTNGAVFYSSAGNLAGVRVRASGNSWDYGTAAPSGTNGKWPQGYVRRNDSATSGGAAEWVCTAAGTPGTWTALTLN